MCGHRTQTMSSINGRAQRFGQNIDIGRAQRLGGEHIGWEGWEGEHNDCEHNAKAGEDRRKHNTHRGRADSGAARETAAAEHGRQKGEMAAT